LRNSGANSNVHIAGIYGPTTLDYDASAEGTSGIVVADGKFLSTAVDNPDVSKGVSKLYFTNSGAIALTTITGGIAGQIVTVLMMGGGTLTVTNGTPILMKGSADAVLSGRNSVTLLCNTAGVWVETNRNV
jgi:hypothetical protein